MLLAGVGLLTVGFGLLPLVEVFAEAWWPAWLVATTVLAYLGFSLYLVNGLPFMMAATGVEERNHVFSVHIALIPLAAFVGSLLAGSLPDLLARLFSLPLADAAAYRWPLWLAGLLLVPGVVALAATRPVDEGPSPPGASGGPEPGGGRAPYGLLLVVALIMALRFGGRGTVLTFFNVYLDEALGVSTSLIGALAAVGQLLSVPAALLAPWLMARWGSWRTIFGGTLSVAFLILPLALIPHWAAAGLGFMSSSALFVVTVGPIRVFSQELVAPRWRASMASAFMMGAGLAFAASSLVGGYTIAAFGYRPLFWVSAALMAAGALLFGSFFRETRSQPAFEPLPEGGE
jgi:predicted MFS family arabinose efflux permease